MDNVDVICLGASVVDIPLRPVSKDIFDFESYPLDHIGMTIGGDAINEATIITRLGKKVKLISLVGDDVAGRFIIDHCISTGIDCSAVKLDKEVTTSLNVGLVREDGERTFVTNRNGSLWKFGDEHIKFESIKNAKILSLASFFNNPKFDNNVLVKVFKKAKKENMIIVADMIKPRLGERFDDISEALGYVDYFFPNYDEAKLMTGLIEEEKIADKILSYGVGCVIIKVGSKGAYIKSFTGEEFYSPSMKDIEVVDTIGAGDNFASGFITGILENKSLEESALFANATAAISIQHLGATTGVTERRLVEELLEKNK